MKVFGAKRTGGYSGGVIMVAAHSLEEAIKVAATNEQTRWMFDWIDEEGKWAYEGAPGARMVSDYYPYENWQEFPQLEYLGNEPCVIIEDGHTE